MRQFDSLSRRTYLRAAGAAVGSTVLGSAGVAAVDFDDTVNIVEAGADDTGEEPIDDVFAEVAENDTLVEFPDGRYRVDHLSLYALENFGMRATGDATLVAGESADPDVWIGGADVRNLLIEGFTLDHTADDVSPLVVLDAKDGVVLRDLVKRGTHDGTDTAFSVRVDTDDGTGLVENVRAPDGDGGAGATGLYINTTGTVTVRDCEIAGFTDNGLYGSHSTGAVEVEGGRFANNDVAQVRLGSEGSYVKGTKIVVDDPPVSDGNQRGVRVADGDGPVTVEDCEIRLETGQGGGGVVGAYSGGSFTVRNTSIVVEREYTTVGSGGADTGYAVLVDEPTGVDDPGRRVLEDVTVAGDGHDHAAMLFRRGNNELSNLCIEQGGDERDGLVFAAGTGDNVVETAAIEVPGTQIVADGDVTTNDITDEADCTVDKVTWRPASDTEDDSTTTSTTESTTDSTETTTATPTDTPTSTPTETATSTPTDTPTTSATESTTADRHWSDLDILSTPGNDVYAAMGTHDDNPTATFYGNFKCPYTREFVEGNLQHIVDEFVRSGDLNLRHRTLAYETSDPDEPAVGSTEGSELAARYALAVWDVEPENYWPFFYHVYHNQPDGRWVTEDRMVQFMKEAGVRNWGKVRWLVEDDRYRDAVQCTTQAARDDGISLVPRLVFRGDAIAPHRDTDTVLEWIRERL